MPGVTRVTTDSAGGVITGPGESSVFVNGAVVSVIGDAVTGHGPTPHDGATLLIGSITVFAGGIGVVRAGDLATCGHSPSGSTDVIAG